MLEQNTDINNVLPIGFIGLGVMGQPMALNLVKAGTELIVWNRSKDKYVPFSEAGAIIADSVDEVFEKSKIIILMLVDNDAIDKVLGRNTKQFASRISDHIIINMSSVAPDYSIGLGMDIHSAGGNYIEAPVSGSRKPAENGELVVLLGGNTEIISQVRPILNPLCKESVICGKVGDALLMKLAINLFLNTMLVGLSEGMHFAAKHGLDLKTYQAAIDSGPMSSNVTKVKIPKLAERDFSVQAATQDAFTSCSLIAEAAEKAKIATPLLNLSRTLYGESVNLGNGRLDMVSVIQAIEKRTDALNQRENQT